MQLKVDVSNRTIFRVFAIGLGFVLAVQLVLATRHALMLILVAFFLAIALSPAVNFLVRKMPRKSRGLATGAVYILAISLVVILATSLMPPIVRQTVQLVESFPDYIEELQEADGFLGTVVNYYDLDEGTGNLQDSVLNRVSGAGEPVITVLERVFSNLVSTLTVLVLTFFMLVEGPKWVKKFWELQPKGNRKHRKKLVQRMYNVITSFVNGQLIIASINGVATFIILAILGVPFALSLAGIVAVLGIIPVIGATLGAVLVIAVGLFESVTVALILTIYFVAYQQVENNVIQPAIQSKSLGMSPLLILASVVVGITLAGILGGLLAIPIAGCIRILVIDYLEQHNLAHS